MTTLATAPEVTLELAWRPVEGPWLVEVGSPGGGLERVLGVGESRVLGTRGDPGWRLDDATVSARHCEVRGTAEGVVIVDRGSRNGLFAGGVRVSSARLDGRGGSVTLGCSTLSVRPAEAVDGVGTAPAVPGLVGASVAMRRVADMVARHARLRAPVLIHGESGTGKDVVARALHRLGRAQGPYVPVNVGAITESLADSELFGHQRGAFTGAVAARVGAFEQADRGTLFLDEIAELPPGLQVKLLRVVEDGEVRPVGGTRPVQVDVRIVSASWASLEDRVRVGAFRVDLYHRLSTFIIRLPPLRDRPSDLPALSRFLLDRLERDVGPRRLAPGALARLAAYSWPGNVRELNAVLYRAAVATTTEAIDAVHIELALPTGRQGRPVRLDPGSAQRLLVIHGGSISKAAKAAGVARSTFRVWMEGGSGDGGGR